MKRSIRTLGVVSLCVVLCVAVQGRADDDGSDDCAVCHDQIAAAFDENVHGIAARGGPSCVTCHGDGAAHMDEGGDPSLIAIPSGAEGATMCLECHQGTRTMFSDRSVHADNDVDCTTCHDMHPDDGGRPALLSAKSTQLCASCHPHQASSFRRPYGHDLDRGGLDCASCHNPHGGTGDHGLKADRAGDGPCVSCHAEKRGPFAFPHVHGITGDCMSCHVPHGASNPMALTRSRVDQLCLECHSRIVPPNTLGSQTPSSHDLVDPRYRNCTTCHVAIHGSNTSPALLK